MQSAYLFCTTVTARIARSDPWKWQQNVINSMNSNRDNCAMSVFENRSQIQKGLLLTRYQRVNWLHTAWLSVAARRIREHGIVKAIKPAMSIRRIHSALPLPRPYLRIKVCISDRINDIIFHKVPSEMYFFNSEKSNCVSIKSI